MKWIIPLFFAGIYTACFPTAHAQGLPKTMLRLPDTGQLQSFTNTFGEDSDYAYHLPFFQDNGNGTVTDTVTGLMWQQVDGGEMSFESAQVYCNALTLGGFDNWRLPTAQEAFSILHHGTSNPAINTVVFPDTDAEYWWTVEQQVGNTSKVWVTNAGGGIGNHPKSETISAGGTKRFHVRAVRDMAAPALLSNQFTWQDSTVIDQLTGLEWQRFVFADSMTWEQALGYAENLVVNGKTDWRLPNIKELESLNDESISQPSINPAVFQGIGANRYWSSTSLPNQATRAWYMDARFGVITYNLKTARNNILCVRGGNEILTEVVDRNRQAHQVQVFPNPFYSYIIVKTEQLLPVVQLMDINGLVLFSGQNIENEDFSYLPSGVYFLRFLQPNTLVIRIIKK